MIAASATQAAFAGNEPDGRWASGPSLQSAKTSAEPERGRGGAPRPGCVVILSFGVSRGCGLRRPVVDSVADGTLAA